MAKEYEVLKIDELQRMNDTQGIEKYYRIQIRTAGKIVLNVDADEKAFTVDKAASILLKAAQNADAIKAL